MGPSARALARHLILVLLQSVVAASVCFCFSARFSILAIANLATTMWSVPHRGGESALIKRLCARQCLLRLASASVLVSLGKDSKRSS